MIFFVKKYKFSEHPLLSRYFSHDPEILSDLAQITENGITDESEITETFNRVISSFRIGSTYKKTEKGRLKETEQFILDFAKEWNNNDLRILDLGASDGSTTLDLAKKMREINSKRIEIILGDKNLCLQRFRYWFLNEYRSESGEPIFSRIGKLGLLLAKHRFEHGYSISALARRYLKLNGLRKRFKPSGEISLVNPFVLKSKLVTPLRIDCLEEVPELRNSFAVIRVCNLLNISYFSEEQIAAAIAILHSYLLENGLLLVSRDDESSGNGSVWLKQNKKFQLLSEFGSGSEIKNLVNNFRIKNYT